MGIPVLEGYGTTETSPVIAVSNFFQGGVEIGTAGPVLPGTRVRIAEDGEILTKGPHVMKGYHNLPEQTAEVIDADGWLHTGDLGELTPEGRLKITGRKKEMFKTAFGKYVVPTMARTSSSPPPSSCRTSPICATGASTKASPTPPTRR